MSKIPLSRNSKILFGMLGLIWSILAALYLEGYQAWDWRDVLGFFPASVLAIYHFGLLFDNLTIDDNGFLYRSFGITYSGKWSDVKSITNQKTILPGLGIEGIYISKRKLTSGNQWYTPQELFIPISRFVPNWQSSELRQKVNDFIAQAH